MFTDLLFHYRGNSNLSLLTIEHCQALHLHQILVTFLLSAVSDVLTNLKGIATEMGTELDRQNDQLGRLETKVDVNTGHLSQANRRIRKQL